jgi:lysophospholipase L1-like esterase
VSAGRASIAVAASAAAAFAVVSLLTRGPAPAAGTYVPPSEFAAAIAHSSAPQKAALFVGDSYTDGAAGVSRSDTYASRICASYNWICNIDAIGGSGFTNGGERSYPQRLPETRDAWKGDYVFITGGRNDIDKDTNAGDEDRAIQRYFTDVRSAYPDSKIFVLEAFWVNDSPPPELKRLRLSERQAARSIEAVWVPTQTWLLRPGTISTDGVHPTPLGHQRIHDRLARVLRQNAVRPGPPIDGDGVLQP